MKGRKQESKEVKGREEQTEGKKVLKKGRKAGKKERCHVLILQQAVEIACH